MKKPLRRRYPARVPTALSHDNVAGILAARVHDRCAHCASYRSFCAVYKNYLRDSVWGDFIQHRSWESKAVRASVWKAYQEFQLVFRDWPYKMKANHGN